MQAEEERLTEEMNRKWDLLLGHLVQYETYKEQVVRFWVGLSRQNPAWTPTTKLALESIEFIKAIERTSQSMQAKEEGLTMGNFCGGMREFIVPMSNDYYQRMEAILRGEMPYTDEELAKIQNQEFSFPEFEGENQHTQWVEEILQNNRNSYQSKRGE